MFSVPNGPLPSAPIDCPLALVVAHNQHKLDVAITTLEIDYV
jgi:hypothetical protein